MNIDTDCSDDDDDDDDDDGSNIKNEASSSSKEYSAINKIFFTSFLFTIILSKNTIPRCHTSY